MSHAVTAPRSRCRTWRTLTLAGLLAALVFGASLGPASASEGPSLAPGSPAPNFSFVDINDKPGELADLRGKVVLLDFWGSWCGPCRTDTPRLVSIYDEFKDRGLEILAVHRGDDRYEVWNYALENGMNWPQVVQQDDGPILQQYEVQTYPTYYLLDRDGKIVDAKIRLWKLPALLAELFPSEDEPTAPAGQNASPSTGTR